ncbi:Tetratricopeptide repeat protein [Planctomycetes bacterium Poly30]|uniref:Tetratricopeptide repeat protein n=1 Tax=Saltatorellus ferox TaxID=2528018 RepID=A0A518EV17_9BACT|nr:Tetratricopeptide repeat protein [Planctomycetes bacterium Poly30]
MIAIHRGGRSHGWLTLLAACLAAFVAFATPTLAQESEPDTVEAWLAIAREHEANDDPEAAFEAYGNALKIDRTHEEACLGYAARAWEIDRGIKGIQVLNRLLREQPDHVDALAYRGFLHQTRDKDARAIRDLERVANEASASWTLTYYARALLYEGDFPEASIQSSRALEYDELDSYAFWVRGYAAFLTGDEESAARDFARAVELDPEWAEAPYQAVDPGGLDPEDEAVIEAVGTLLKAALCWAILLGLIGLVVGLGGSSYLVPAARRQEAGIQPAYDGPHKELFTIYLQNVALTLLTLGVYRFWAKVRTRRFHLTHTVFADGRFDYHATGQEKFVGFLKGMAILVPFGYAYYRASQWVDAHPTEVFAQIGLNYGLFFGLVLIRPLALVGAQRFNLARTSWNNLRFRFTGTLKGAYGLYLRDAFLIIFSLGIYWSWHLCNVKRFKLSHTKLGEERGDFTGDGSTLFGIQLVGYFASILTLGLYVPWYLAARHRFWTEHTKFMRKRFHSTLSGKAVLAVGGPGLLASIFTLGLAIPWAVTRWRRMIAATTLYSGQIDHETLASIQDHEATSTLEGIGEAGELFGEIGDLFGI